MLLRDIDLAEDAVQATMLRVFRRWDQAREAPEAYSRQALINICRDHWRRQARHPEDLLGEAALDTGRTVSFTEDVELREALIQTLGELSGLQRAVLVLRYFFDLPLAEVARVLAVPEGTARSAAHRGLARMRTILSPPEGAEHAE